MIDSIAAAHADAFLVQLTPDRIRERWRSLLFGKQKGWRKIDPHVLWGLPASQGVTMLPVENRLDKFCYENLSERVLNAPAVAFFVGHSHPGIEHVSLSSLLKDQLCVEGSSLLDGIVSIYPGALALVANHDGEFALLKR
jgi:hypothetical protein